MEQLTNTIKYMKDLIERREKSWTQSVERDTKLQTHIKALEHENTTLRELIKNKKINVDELQLEEIQPQIIPCKENGQLKKIIVKLEKKFRDMENSNGEPLRFATPLNDKEKKIVQILMTKYNLRQQNKKSNEKIRSRSISRGPYKEITPNVKTGIQCQRCKTPKKEESVLTNMGFKCDKNADTAIMMMDHLFESEHKLI